MNFFNFNRRRNPDEDHHIEGERDETNVNEGDSIQTRMTRAALIIVALLVLGFGMYRYVVTINDKRATAIALEKRDDKQQLTTNLPPLKPPVFPDPAPPVVAPPAPPPMAQQYASGADAARQPSAAELQLTRRLTAPLSFMAASGGAGNSNAGSAENGSAASGANSASSAKFSAIKAFMLPDPSMMVSRGTGIPCVVRPAINSTLQGMVTCIQKADVYSADNKILLMERGTKWVGVQSVGLQQGMARIGMVWQRAETPNHVLVPINTGSGDALGRPGIEGVVDTHFWRRIGEAVAVSLISDVGSFISATQKSGNNNTTIQFPNTVSGTQGAMSEMLKKSLDIPDIMTKNQGAEIVIFIQNEDLDFRDVYTLQAKQ